METHINPADQEKQAKLSLLILDDDHANQQILLPVQSNQNSWGRSLETQSFLRQKLSQRYRSKRRSLKQLKVSCFINRQPVAKKAINQNKQSLKNLLKKLESKELKTSNQEKENQRRRTITVFNSNQQARQSNKKVNQTILEVRKNKSYSQRRGVLKQSFLDNEKNNFISKKIQLISNRNPNFSSIQKQCFGSENNQNSLGFDLNELRNKRAQLTESKNEKKKRKLMFKINNENKQNQSISMIQFQGECYTQKGNGNIILFKNQRPFVNSLDSQSITKRTFQILQQINRAKSIKNIKKLASQSLKLKKSNQMCPYSWINKQKKNTVLSQGNNWQNNKIENNFIGNAVGNKNNFLKNTIESSWVKLQIRR